MIAEILDIKQQPTLKSCDWTYLIHHIIITQLEKIPWDWRSQFLN